MKTSRLPKKRRPPFGYIYPVFCGLVVGGMLGGLMHSFFMFALFGGITWLYFYSDLFHVLPAGGVPVACDAEADWQAADDLKSGPFIRDFDAHVNDPDYAIDIWIDITNMPFITSANE